MRPLRTFTIEPALPDTLLPLKELAYNLWWCWHGDAQDLFRRLDSGPLGGDAITTPWPCSGASTRQRLAQAADGRRVPRPPPTGARDAQGSTSSVPAGGRGPTAPRPQPQVAYFCAEFGLTECLPIYSGGLGVLAGDHLKSASDLGLPLVGVGLLYQQGYFRQHLNADGWQLELFPRNDFHNMPVELVRNADGTAGDHRGGHARPAGHARSLEGAGRARRRCSCWTPTCRRTPRRTATSPPSSTAATRRCASARRSCWASAACGRCRRWASRPKVYHMNEGHSAFLALERIRLLMAEQGVSFDEAREAVVAANVFTTHTPVPAGNDAFEPWLIDQYFEQLLAASWASARDQFLALGRQDPATSDEPMSLTVLALRLSSMPQRRQQAARHGQPRGCGTNVWPGVPGTRCPSRTSPTACTPRSWLSHDMADLFDRYLGPGWHEKPADPSVWKRVDADPRRGAVAHARAPARAAGGLRPPPAARATAPSAAPARPKSAAADEVLDPEALTIGFARRFATYKRATLILRGHRAAGQAAEQHGPPRADHLRRQGPPARQPGQGPHPPDRPRRPPGAVPQAHRLPRGLRHQRRPLPGAGRGRVAEHAAAADGGQRHQRHEGRRQRRAQLSHPGRLVGRGLRARRRLGHRLAARPTTTWNTRTASRARPSTTCWRRRSSRCSTTAAPTSLPAGLDRAR